MSSRTLNFIGRAALAAPFIQLGYGAATEPGGRVNAASAIGIPNPELAVRFNGAAMVAGGTALALGILPRAAATGLILSLAPTTFAGHPFWKEADPVKRNGQLIHLLKNVGLMGAMAVVASR